MTCCIATVIKNEHEYLDEWITYHLKLGIEHIFIFEDLDSDTHKEITDKYSDVTLSNVKNVITFDELNIVEAFKLKKNGNPQDIYFPNILAWIKDNYNIYDWCFIIDNDEFITFEKENSDIKEVMKLYNDYDAILLQWKIYGANGYINKPDYINKGLIDTYTKESEFPGHYKMKWTTKTCYKVSTFEKSYYLGIHHPTDKCKWCKTDFSKSIEKQIFNNIYLRHYMTKSWEEYITKRKRGYFVGFTRTADMFFKINPDMIAYKDKLIKDLQGNILVILPYKKNGAQGNEINLALKCWKKFCKFKYHFIVIGEFNKSLVNEFPWVEFINCPTRSKKEDQYNPHLDIQNKFNIVMKMYSQIYDGFIWMTDDNYAIKDFTLSDITTIHYHAMSFSGNSKMPKSFWRYDKWKTRQLLNKENLPCINYTTHYPCYFEFNKLKEIWDKFNMLNESYVVEDIYFNYFTHDKPILDDNIRLGIWNHDIFIRKFDDAIRNENIKFMCNSDEGWSRELEYKLAEFIDYKICNKNIPIIGYKFNEHTSNRQ